MTSSFENFDEIALNSDKHYLTYVTLFLKCFVEFGLFILPNGSRHRYVSSLKIRLYLFYKMAAMTSSYDQITSNLNAHPLAYVKLFFESFVETGPVVSPNGSGHTDRQTPSGFFSRV